MTQVKDITNPRTGKYLAYEERIEIEDYRELDYSNRAIARILNRTHDQLIILLISDSLDN